MVASVAKNLEAEERTVFSTKLIRKEKRDRYLYDAIVQLTKSMEITFIYAKIRSAAHQTGHSLWLTEHKYNNNIKISNAYADADALSNCHFTCTEYTTPHTKNHASKRLAHFPCRFRLHIIINDNANLVINLLIFFLLFRACVTLAIKYSWIVYR